MLLCRWYDVRQERVDLERNVDEVPFTGSRCGRGPSTVSCGCGRGPFTG